MEYASHGTFFVPKSIGKDMMRKSLNKEKKPETQRADVNDQIRLDQTLKRYLSSLSS